MKNLANEPFIIEEYDGKCIYSINPELNKEEFMDAYLDEFAKLGDEIFGFHYIEDYVSLFPKEDEQSVRDSLTRFAESFHKGHNAASVMLLVNKGYIKLWLENNNVRDGYGNLLNIIRDGE